MGYAIVTDPVDAPASAYAPRGNAVEVWKAREFEVVVAGPAETGKTRITLEKLNALCWKYPNMQAVIVRKVYGTMRGSVLQTYERHVLGAYDREARANEDGFLASLSPVKKHGGNAPQFYDYPNGSRIWVAGMDNPGKALSSERDFILVNQAEELNQDEWSTLLTRATGRAGNIPGGWSQVLGDCNPGPRNHWILDRNKQGYLRLINSRHEDNPMLYDDQGQLTKQGVRTMTILDSLPGVLKKRLRYGLWVSVEGIVYEEYEPAVHLIDRFRIPADWPRFIAIDFGYGNPFVCQWWAVSPKGQWYMYREIYHSRILVSDHAAFIRYLSGHSASIPLDNPYFSSIRLGAQSLQPEHIVGGVADHDLEDAATLAAGGVFTVPAWKPIEAGIEQVKTMMQVDSNNRTQVFFFRDALAHEPDPLLEDKRHPVCTVDEFEVYAYPKGVSGRPIKEKPIDLHNHGMDTARYLLATLHAAPVQIRERVYNPVAV